MVLKLHIDEASEEVTVKLEDLRKLFHQSGLSDNSFELPQKEPRIKILEDAIKKAILELEKTKTSFKSKKIKEVRKDLTMVLNNQVLSENSLMGQTPENDPSIMGF